MNRPIDPVSDDDLQAYVDDELDMARRIDVEAYLSGHPIEASRVMADLRIRDELRLALTDAPRAAWSASKVTSNEAARRLGSALSRARLFRRVQQAAVVALLVGTGWLAHSQMLGVTSVVASALPPAYLDEAVTAHRNTLMRAAASPPGATGYDPAEIRAATAIVMPELPGDWKVADVQVLPSAFGPSVEMSVATKDFGTVSLFAVRPGSFDVVPATLVLKDDLNAAYWQVGEVAYALVAKADSRELDKAASKLARSLY